MPIYEYICEDCNERFEKIVINKQQEISCPIAPARKPRFSFPFSPRPALAVQPRPPAALQA
jgi:putative FmdB family regulatory protein